MENPKITALYEIYLNRKGQNILPETHLAWLRIERIEKAFSIYGPETTWEGRKAELVKLYDDFIFAMTYTNEFGKTGYTFGENFKPIIL